MDIALLEDNPSDARLIRTFLESAEHQCHVFDKGQLLLDELPRQNHSLIMLDWELPDIPGDQILRWIRNNIGWDLPVIFVTGRDSSEDIIPMLDAGSDAYMVKPVNWE